MTLRSDRHLATLCSTTVLLLRGRLVDKAPGARLLIKARALHSDAIVEAEYMAATGLPTQISDRYLHLGWVHIWWSGRDSNCRSSLGFLTLGRGGFHARFRPCYSSGIHPVEPSHSEVCGGNISVSKRR